MSNFNACCIFRKAYDVTYGYDNTSRLKTSLPVGLGKIFILRSEVPRVKKCENHCQSRQTLVSELAWIATILYNDLHTTLAISDLHFGHSVNC